MEATIVQTSVSNNNVWVNDSTETQSKVMNLKSDQQTNSMHEYLKQLSAEVSTWEAGAYASSNATLYGLLQKSYALYLELTKKTDGDLKLKKQGMADYMSANALERYVDKPLPQRIIACVFGKRDRRRIHTYSLVLRYIIAQHWEIADVPAMITAAGGVQEISLGRPSSSMTTKEKVAVASHQVKDAVLARVRSTELSNTFDPEKTGERFAAVLTQEADGSYSINCMVKSSTAVNAALAAYFNANKVANNKAAEEQEAANELANAVTHKEAAINYPLAA